MDTDCGREQRRKTTIDFRIAKEQKLDALHQITGHTDHRVCSPRLVLLEVPLAAYESVKVKPCNQFRLRAELYNNASVL